MRNVVAIDIGYSNVKLAVARGSASSEKVFPAGVAPAELYHNALAHTGADKSVKVDVNGDHFVAAVAQHCMGGHIRVLDENYTDTVDYKALFLAALFHSKTDSIDMLVTGVPAYQLKDKARIERLKAQMLGTHKVNGSRRVRIKEVKVYGQPMGAFADLFVTASEQYRNIIKQSHVLVIDPGFFSVDWVMVSHGSVIDRTISSSKQAVSVVLEEACDLIKHDYDIAPSLVDLEAAIRAQSKFVLAGGSKVTLAKYLDQASKLAASIVTRQLQSDLRQLDYSPNIVLIAGGGADIYRKAVATLFPKADVRLAASPVLANVRGFLSLGLAA